MRTADVARIGKPKIITGFADDLATREHLDSKLSGARGKHKGELRIVLACNRCNHARGAEEVAKLGVGCLSTNALLRRVGRVAEPHNAESSQYFIDWLNDPEVLASVDIPHALPAALQTSSCVQSGIAGSRCLDRILPMIPQAIDRTERIAVCRLSATGGPCAVRSSLASRQPAGIMSGCRATPRRADLGARDGLSRSSRSRRVRWPLVLRAVNFVV